jgi:hypothetical protein
MIDYWRLTRDFQIGDTVQKFMPGRSGDLSPYHGRVTAVLPGIGFVDVQWPFGNERVSPEDLIKLNPKFVAYLPPTLDFSWYPGQDTQTELRKASNVPSNLWRTIEVPQGFHKVLAKIWNRGANEVQAYDELWHRYASYSDDSILRDEVAKFYAFSRNAAEMFFQTLVNRTATYWMAQNRQHRATNEEIERRKPNCPRCGLSMRKATYKMREGQRVKLFVCPKDFYILKREDIFGPDGNPVEW